MTLLNIVSIVVLVSIIAAAIGIYIHLKRKIQEAEGLLSINERGEAGTSPKGDIVGEL